MKSRMHLPFAFLCGVPFVMVLSNSLLIPVLPLLQAQMNLTPFQSGLIVTAFSIPAGLTIPVVGYLSDRFGRKVIIVPSLIIFGLGGLLAGIAAWLTPRPFAWMLAARVLQGLGGGGTYQIAMALAGDIFQTSERAKVLGLLEAANGLGKVVSPILGSLAGLLVWFAPFFLYPILATPVAIGVWLLVKEPSQQTEPPGARAYLIEVGQILKKNAASLMAAFLIGWLILFMLFGVLSFLSDVLDEKYGLQGVKKGLIIAIPVLAMATTSFFSGAWLQNQNNNTCKWVSTVGIGLVAAALLLLSFKTTLYSLLANITLQGIGTGLTLPAINLLITGTAPQKERGMLTALYGTVRFFGVAFGPPTFGLLAAKNESLLFLLSAIITLLAALLGFVYIQSPPMPRNKNSSS